MDKQTVLTIMDAMAEKIEALTERVEAAEKKLAEQCSCREWASNFRLRDSSLSLDQVTSEIIPQG